MLDIPQPVPYCEECTHPVSDPVLRLQKTVKPACFEMQGPWRCPFLFQENAVQHGQSDYANAVQIERGISIDEAMHIALNSPDIDYFFYVTGEKMLLEAPQDAENDPLGLLSYHWEMDDSGIVQLKLYRIFEAGDAVFFSGEGIWLGDANGLANVYHKKMSINSGDTR